MRQIIDLTPVWEENMAMNHPYHPRAPLIWAYARHEFCRYYIENEWKTRGRPPLFDNLPPEATDPNEHHGWQSEQMLIGTHMATHIDAPLHWDPKGHDAADIPLERCYGEAILLDFRHLCQEPYPIKTSDLEQAEKRADCKVQKGDIVIIHTGWSARWGYGPNADALKYGLAHSVNPGLDKETPPWFIDRDVKLVGCDAPSLDYDLTQSNHVNFLWRGRVGKQPIYIVENLANLDRIPKPRFIFAGFPLPIRSGSGSPIRAVAIVEE